MAKKKKANQPKKIVNRKARHDYAIDDSLVVGMELTGAETKSLRMGHGNLRGAYVTLKDSSKGGELYLINATISGSSGISIDESEQSRTRKLLAKRKEIEQLIQAKKQGMTIIPLEILTGGKYIKLRVAAARGRKQYDKRRVLKERDEKRTMDAAIKNR